MTVPLHEIILRGYQLNVSFIKDEDLLYMVIESIERLREGRLI